jgi:hypothetical protein
MKFLKANQRPLSAEDELAVARLMELAQRTKARMSDTDEQHGPSELPDAPESLEPRETLQ